MLIDIHTHLTLNNYPEFAKGMLGRPAFTADVLLKRMDMEGIERSVLLPLCSPENMDFYGVAGNSECLDAARRHPDRFDVFCNIDPRTMINKASDSKIRTLFEIYRDLGCKVWARSAADCPWMTKDISGCFSWQVNSRCR